MRHLWHAATTGTANASSRSLSPGHTTPKFWPKLCIRCCCAATGGAVAFGDKWNGECGLPEVEPGASCVQTSARCEGKMLLRNDGRDVACGNNEGGQCDTPEPEPGATSITDGIIRDLVVQLSAAPSVRAMLESCHVGGGGPVLFCPTVPLKAIELADPEGKRCTRLCGRRLAQGGRPRLPRPQVAIALSARKRWRV